MIVRVLAAMPSPREQRRLRDLLMGPGVLTAGLGPQEVLWERLAAEPFDLVLVDAGSLPLPVADSVRAIRNLPGAPDVVVLTAGSESAAAAELVAAGCLAVLDRNLANETLHDSLGRLVERSREEARLRLEASTAPDHRMGDFVTSSPAMARLVSIARRVAASDTTLLILGETGVGKEWLARAIHAEGPRAREAFLAVNCGAIPEGLLESELFGHREGAFTGATRDHRGHFELAHGGTIFLDEIGETPFHVQVKLLRALQERKIQPVGGERLLEVDVRVMAATNRDPREEIRAGRLREDLYYRLGVVTLEVPALRERREDIPTLAENYFEIYRTRLGRSIWGIDADAMQALVDHDWPGNVRELINVMERAVLLCPHDEIGREDLPEAIRGRSLAGSILPGDGDGGGGGDLREEWLARPLREARRAAADDFERRYLAEWLRRTGGRVGETARRAGMTPRALFERMRRLGLRKEDYRGNGHGEADG